MSIARRAGPQRAFSKGNEFTAVGPRGEEAPAANGDARSDEAGTKTVQASALVMAHLHLFCRSYSRTGGDLFEAFSGSREPVVRGTGVPRLAGSALGPVGGAIC